MAPFSPEGFKKYRRIVCSDSNKNNSNQNGIGQHNVQYHYISNFNGSIQLQKPSRGPTGLLPSEDTKPFIWKKKLEKDGRSKISHTEARKLQKRKIEENKDELDSIKRRRSERENQRDAREREREEVQREKDESFHKQWDSEEDSFYLKQTLLRTRIRLKRGCGQPIDYLARYVDIVYGNDGKADEQVPFTRFDKLTFEHLEDLLADILVFQRLHTDNRRATAWKLFLLLVNYQLDKLNDNIKSTNIERVSQRSALNAGVENTMLALLQNKNLNQLIILEEKIHKKLGRESNLDISYWERLLYHISAAKAKQIIHSDYCDYLARITCTTKRTVTKDECENPKESASVIAHQLQGTQAGAILSGFECRGMFCEIISDSCTVPFLNQEDIAVVEKESSSKIQLKDPEDDWMQLQRARKKVLDSIVGRNRVIDSGANESNSGSSFGQDDLNEDENVFSCECAIPATSDEAVTTKKPRYFNKVQTGFVWNRYNRTHYDQDHPPPKMVMGYKFNVYLEDRLDPSKLPTYTLTPCTDDPDLAVLQISGGPPYEDIAFRIVNREWERSWKSGYKCQLYRGVFQLWFRFKKRIYRR